MGFFTSDVEARLAKPNAPERKAPAPAIPRQDRGIDGQTVYIKWNDDRGRSFENAQHFVDWGECIEFTYSNPEAGRANIRVYKKEIRWLEFYDTPPAED